MTSRLTEIVNCDVQAVYAMAPCGEVRSGTVELRGPVKDFGWDGSERIRDADGTFIATARPDLTKETIDSGVDGELPQLVVFHMGQTPRGVNAITSRGSCIPLSDLYSLSLERRRDGQYVRLGLAEFQKGMMGADDEYCTGDLGYFFRSTNVRTVIESATRRV